ncbi:MAG: pirin family protein [Alphaproteobacteria bacterium]|nr:pirin family protein [Alphaproteobacteria bacterium]
MVYIRKSEERGITKTDWLNSKHTFSFGHYYDENHVGFGSLLVINEDIVKPNAGFGKHPHHDMEIISYVLEGVLEHKDSLGTGSIILPGDVQRMSAGIGITHSEFNPQKEVPVHFLQIWITPDKLGLTPSYEQKSFLKKRESGQLTLLASHDGYLDSLILHQDVNMFVLDLNADEKFTFLVEEGRMIWVQIVRGSVQLNQHILQQGDGIGIKNETSVNFQGKEKVEILIFDLINIKD